ncbi:MULTISPECIES: Hint domain-containing protein [unclassified Ruegeria]|uniref:Hint domain-containing protein n=1 Tax=unclassified Ruegeria TaxID=2625375 RepID=UPI001ADC02A2|nr:MULTISPECIES: Hint domain-containing protein [unclassified Ruegeria]MBO9411083.1 Hint domain-containing protein [Ruegeria sp. R8_1]MBO9415284.1 Hint domain-containing protein [Ruegeria sp. R8_2]
MPIPHSLSRAAKNAADTSAMLRDAPRDKPKAQLRRYEVSALLPNGDISQTRHIAPALPMFEDAFCAFTRGSLIETETGPLAIEDLLPGDTVLTQDGSSQTVLWKGSVTLVPGREDSRGRTRPLTRIMADTFGMQKPMSGVIAGPAARLVGTPSHLRHLHGNEAVLTPVHEFQDGMSVVETLPPTPIELFHICLKRHSVIKIDGLQFETYHPGVNAVRMISHSLRSIYLNLFAHADSLNDFGPLLMPRAGDGEVDAITA